VLNEALIDEIKEISRTASNISTDGTSHQENPLR
jgi:hypothetical protein